MERDWRQEASRLLAVAQKLEGDYRKVFEYFVKYVSVGDLRAEAELSRLGVKDPINIIEELVDMGLLERGIDCYNLARPLRRYYARSRGL